MVGLPKTRGSLLARLKDHADADAWSEFAEIYRPVIVRVAKSRQMQDADAEEVAQQVLTAVAKAIDRWEEDPDRARFRTWLHRIMQNLIVNAATRQKPDRGRGDSANLAVLSQHPMKEGIDSDLVRLEYRRECFRWAARQIRKEFQPDTWQAFWLTAVENRDVNEVALTLGRSRGSVYAARSRVMKRLRQKIAEVGDDQ